MVRDKGELTIPSINNPIPPSSSSNYSSIQPKEVAQNNTIEQNKDKETKATEEDWKEKSKQRNVTKINFSELLQKKEENQRRNEQKKEEPKLKEEDVIDTSRSHTKTRRSEINNK